MRSVDLLSLPARFMSPESDARLTIPPDAVCGSERRSRWRRGVLALPILALTMAGCTVIPKDGPTSGAVVNGAASSVSAGDIDPLNYVYVKLSPQVIETVNADPIDNGQKFPSSLGNIRQADVRLSAGDRVSITVFEAAAGGLFIPAEAGSRAGNFVQIPTQQVDSNGEITVPYAGVVHAEGRTARDISHEVSVKLGKRAIEPQVVVTIDERRSSEISVLGEVGAPIRFPLDPGGTRLLGALARAGGNKYPNYESMITLQRHGLKYTARLSSIVKSPSQDVQLEGGDVIYVAREPRIYMAFGATPYPGVVGGISSRRFSFDDEVVSLAEAVAKAGGLDTTRSNPSAVFVYRIERKDVLQKLGMDTSHFPGPFVPTIYSLDFRKGDGLFLAQSFFMRNQDALYAADSETVDIVKILTVLQTANSAVTGVRAAGSF